MEYLKLLFDKVSSRKFTLTIVNTLCLSIIFLIGYISWPLWSGIVSIIISLIKPFFIGFLIAYVCNPFLVMLEKKGMSRSAAIFVVIIIMLFIIVLFIGTLIPMLYDRASELVNTFSGGLGEIQDWIYESFEFDIAPYIQQIREYIFSIPEQWDVLDNTIDIVSSILSTFSTYVIYFVLSIYFMSGFNKIKHTIHIITNYIHKNTYEYLSVIDKELNAYVKAMLILMLVKSLIYCVMYFIIGHPNWMILGLLTGLSSIIPYVGPIISNAIGIITALNLPMMSIVLLLVFIAILSNTDNYILGPKIFSKRVELGPLWVLFGLLAGSTLYGITGVIIAVPILLIIRITFQTYVKRHPNVIKESN